MVFELSVTVAPSVASTGRFYHKNRSSRYVWYVIYSQTINQYEQDRSQEIEDHEYIGEQRNCCSIRCMSVGVS